MASISDRRLVLAAGVRFIAVSELSADVRRRINAAEDDITVSRPGYRGRSQLLSAGAAHLAQLFAQPRHAAEALAALAAQSGEDLDALSEAAAPALAHLLSAGILQPYDEERPELTPGVLEEGAVVDGQTIVRLVSQFDDVAVYQARTPRGDLCALKLAQPRAAPGTATRLQHEAAVLGHLRGRGAPPLYSTGKYDGRTYLSTLWRAGQPVSAVAAVLRQEGKPYQLLQVAVRLLDAYASLHARGVIHGDVRPHNALADEQGRVTLIDFGLAVLEGASGEPASLPGGGDPFYFPPEVAASLLAGKTLPRANRRSEQYALAALLFLMLSGRPYLPFRLERRAALQQIVTQHPPAQLVPQLPPWPVLETVLERALAKDPLARYPSMGHFRSAFIRATRHTRRSAAAGADKGLGQPLLRELRQRFGVATVDAGQAPRLSPRSSLAYGAAGVAHLLLRMARQREDAAALVAAERWIGRAIRDLGHEDAFSAPGLELNSSASAPGSYYNGELGVHVTHAAIAATAGDEENLRAAIQATLQTLASPLPGPDLFSGRAGALLALSELAALAAGTGPALAAAGNKLARGLQDSLAGSEKPGVPEMDVLGMAHGRAGILYALLRWQQSSGLRPDPFVRRHLTGLAGMAIWAGKEASWPLALGDPRTPWSGWCHGSAGYVHLWLLAHRVWSDGDFLALAEAAGRHSANHPARQPHRCCGLAGQAEALRALFEMTRHPAWLERSDELAELAFQGARSAACRPSSLLKGDAGIALLALDY